MTGVPMSMPLIGAMPVYNFVISANTANIDWRAMIIAAGWNQIVPFVSIITINNGITVYSTSTGTAALRQGGAFPFGTQAFIANNGVIVGKGGDGGAGGAVDNITAGNGFPGGTGGDAVQLVGITGGGLINIDNQGTLAGGGGGGGGSGAAVAAWFDGSTFYIVGSSGAGGGGGGGFTSSPAPGGASGGAGNTMGGAGNNGTNSGGAAGTRAAEYVLGPLTVQGGSAAPGGNRGISGTSALNNAVATGPGGGTFNTGAPGAGGAPGRYMNGNTHANWLNTGTRLGNVA